MYALSLYLKPEVTNLWGSLQFPACWRWADGLSAKRRSLD